MAKLRLTLAVGDYDVNRALIQGEVQPEGIELIVLPLPAPERHRRMAQHLEFDAAEFSLSSYLVLRARRALPLTAIPAFPLRKMRHGSIYVHTGKGIRAPQDLHGRRVGLRQYQVTAGLWARGILAEFYGVDLSRITWVASDPEEIPFEPPPWLKLEHLPPGANLDRTLAEGELDACIYPELLPSYVNKDPRVARLFPDSKREEMECFRRTGIIPIMHCVVVRDAVLEQHPWVAVSLLKAFRQSKELHLRRMRRDSLFLQSLVWFRELWEEQEALMGPDPFPYEFAAARPALAAACRYAHQQGLTPRLLEPEELFHPATLKELPEYVS